MYQDQFASSGQVAPVAVGTPKRSKMDSWAFYIFLAAVILAPILFLPITYLAVDAIKTLVIALGVLIPAMLYAIGAYKEGRVILPPRSIVWTMVIVALSLVASSFAGLHVGKSFFGQGFELDTASFLLVLFIGVWVAFTALRTRPERATMLYTGMTVSFLVLTAYHLLRIAFGPSFLSLGVMSTLTATPVGSWYDLAGLALIVMIVAVVALSSLPLSGRIKSLYGALSILALAVAFLVNNFFGWVSMVVVAVFLTVYLAYSRRQENNSSTSFLGRIVWLPVIMLIIALVLSWKGVPLAKPFIEKTHTEYTTLNLPWQYSLDVAAGSIKSNALFGAGPNQFGQAYLAHKPLQINNTFAWNAEFGYAFSFLGTIIATQGVLGMLAWGLLIIFAGLTLVRALRSATDSRYNRFVLASSSAVAIFVAVAAFISVPAHSILFYAFIAFGMAQAIGTTSGALVPCTLVVRPGSKSSLAIKTGLVLMVIVSIVWSVIYIKDVVALGHFASGISSLNSGDSVASDRYFSYAEWLNKSDAFLRARAESGISYAQRLASTADPKASASTTEALLTQIKSAIGTAVSHADEAIALDDSNYYNYVSRARVLEFAATLRMDKAYEDAVAAYTQAIRLNPLNPALYLSLAQLQVSQNKLTDALQTLGASLQVKNDYLDAVFLISQVYAAQGNLRDAITAAQVATQINPQNPVLFFQLGLLQYNNKSYGEAAKALETALQTQPDYANAEYFLGLSYARLGRSGDAIARFKHLAESNPDNKDVSAVLASLLSGKSPFADSPATTSTKPSKLPVKEKK